VGGNAICALVDVLVNSAYVRT